MKKIFKSKVVKKIRLDKTLKLLLISFLFAYLLNNLKIFRNETVIEFFKTTSLNEIPDTAIKLNGKYLLNIGLNTFEDIVIDKQVFNQINKPLKSENPVIYIYNTHQTEEYATLKNYNITPTVLTASYILKDKLNDFGIDSIIETSDFKEDLKTYGYNYSNAYKVSRIWLKNLNNPNMKLYIDLHRDSIKYDYSNITINGKDYAKIMLVVGKGYDFEQNMITAQTLLKYIEDINEEISRGIFTRDSGIYNQDYNKNCVLIELGGPESTYESISNSIDILSLAIKNYLGE